MMSVKNFNFAFKFSQNGGRPVPTSVFLKKIFRQEIFFQQAKIYVGAVDPLPAPLRWRHWCWVLHLHWCIVHSEICLSCMKCRYVSSFIYYHCYKASIVKRWLPCCTDYARCISVTILQLDFGILYEYVLPRMHIFCIFVGLVLIKKSVVYWSPKINSDQSINFEQFCSQSERPWKLQDLTNNYR